MSESDRSDTDVEVIVVGAGFAGLYLLHRLRTMGVSARALEAADDVGGTWYWNRYPGARCDVQSIDYSYSFDPELERDWQWTEKYATQPEILRYLNHVADRYDLRRDISFSTRVERAVWDDDHRRWDITTQTGKALRCRFYIMATGCLSLPKSIDIEGVDRFEGATYSTSTWPHEPVDFSGKRVAVIGTGSSGIQSIPIIAREAAALTVFQRTPNFSIPAGNGPIPEYKRQATENRYQEYREEARWSGGGVPTDVALEGALQVSTDERQARYEGAWERGEIFATLGTFSDLLFNPDANETMADFVRGKIRSIVHDPKTAETLCPKDHPFGTKRLCLDSGYYETYNLAHVHLVDLTKDPIETITETGIDTQSASFEFDVIVFATGFDAMTGALVAVDIAGRDDVQLASKWAEGPRTYLGLTVEGFPNLFMITGPGSPSVLSNMAVSIEQHVEWVTDLIGYMRSHGFDTIEPTKLAEDGWVRHVNDGADMTLFPHADSWYMGANITGKPRVFLPFVTGVDAYRRACNDVVAQDYLGFQLRGQHDQCNDGVIRPLQPDVTAMLQIMSDLGLPPIESLSPDEARAFMEASAAERPPGPDVGEIVNGVLPGAASDLAYRLYRPASPGPHPIVAYFHGGGWVLGGIDSDDPFCRDLCVRADTIVVSSDYRHAPEHRFPAASDDATAALRWIAENTEALGGIPEKLMVCGWSAGANLAAVACQTARDAGRPAISGQVLVNPVTDCDLTRPSYSTNGDGYILTKALMEWFWNHYADPTDRDDPRAAPLRAADLSGLPPALIVTSEFDPLRDEGAAYAAALAAAGVDARHIDQRGQIHTSLTAVDMILTGASARADIAVALRAFAAG